MLDFPGVALADEGEVAKQAGNDHPTGIPTGVFPTSDGYINIAASGDNMFKRCATAMAHPSWWIIRNTRRPACARSSQGGQRAHRRRHQDQAFAHWIEALNKAGVPCGPINTIDQTFAGATGKTSRHRPGGEASQARRLRWSCQPINLSDAPQPRNSVRRPSSRAH